MDASTPVIGGFVAGDIFAISFMLLLTLIPASIAWRKGRNFLLWWIYSLPPLWMFALIHSILIKPNEKRLLMDGMKKCPYCAEIIKPEAKVCRFCGRDVPMIDKSM